MRTDHHKYTAWLADTGLLQAGGEQQKGDATTQPKRTFKNASCSVVFFSFSAAASSACAAKGKKARRRVGSAA